MKIQTTSVNSMSNQPIKKTLQFEVDKWLREFGGNSEKIREMINEFIIDTPLMIESFRQKMKLEDWTGAAEIAHKVKVRYSYLGFDGLFQEISIWEDLLKSGNTIEEVDDKLDFLDQITKLISEELDTLNKKNFSPLIRENMTLAGKRILIAEDDEVNALILESFIIDLGGEVTIAHDGFEALKKVDSYSPDLIFMDIHMPFFGGLEAIQQIRKAGKKTPIISLSASSRLNEKDNSVHAGADDFLIKPIDRKSIQSVLEKFLF